MEDSLELNEGIRREVLRQLYDLCIEQMKQLNARDGDAGGESDDRR